MGEFQPQNWSHFRLAGFQHCSLQERGMCHGGGGAGRKSLLDRLQSLASILFVTQLGFLPSLMPPSLIQIV